MTPSHVIKKSKLKNWKQIHHRNTYCTFFVLRSSILRKRAEHRDVDAMGETVEAWQYGGLSTLFFILISKI